MKLSDLVEAIIQANERPNKRVFLWSVARNDEAGIRLAGLFVWKWNDRQGIERVKWEM